MTQPNIVRQGYLDIRKKFVQTMKWMSENVSPVSDEIPNNPTKTVIVKIATTGLSAYYNEILQLTLLDGSGKLLLDTYVKPVWTLQWPEAERANHITPDMVKDAPTPVELYSTVRTILESADLIVGYNLSFDLEFLKCWYVLPQHARPLDIMKAVSRLYGVFDSDFQNRRYLKQTDAVDLYAAAGYEKFFAPKLRNQKYPNQNISDAEDIVFLLHALQHDPARQRAH